MTNNQNQQTDRQQWQREQLCFFREAANRVFSEHNLIAAAFNEAVKQLATQEENAARPMHWLLEEAARQVRALFNVGFRPELAVKESHGKAGELTATGVEDINGDEFSYLDRLDGAELEHALSKLNPEEQTRYLQG